MEEISLSVEETNALRAKLGLKPLRMDNDADGVVLVDPTIRPPLSRKEEDYQPHQEQQDDTQGDAVYDSDALEGMRVGHDLDDFKDGQETILVLKDKNILDEDSEEELVNMEMVFNEKTKVGMEKQRRKNAEDRIDMDKGVLKREVLEKYDAAQKKSFRIQKAYRAEKIDDVQDTQEIVSLVDNGFKIARDYETAEETKKSFKKIKKTQKKARQALAASELPSFALVNDEDDEEMLETALTNARKEKLKEIRASEEELAAQIEEAAKEEEKLFAQRSGVVLTETSLFTNKLKHIDATSSAKMTTRKQVVKSMEIDERSAQPDESHKPEEKPPGKDQVFNEEPVLNKGVAGMLTMLKRQGLLEKTTEEDKLKEQEILERLKWQERRKRGLVDPEDAERFDREYRPSVNLTYVDETGRELTKKEAWKRHCHQFHGREPGKKNKEKQLRKIAEQLVEQKRHTTEITLTQVAAMEEQQKKAGQAYIEFKK